MSFELAQYNKGMLKQLYMHVIQFVYVYTHSEINVSVVDGKRKSNKYKRDISFQRISKIQ